VKTRLKRKIKKPSEIVEDLERLIIRIISLIGWIKILIDVLKSLDN